MVWPDIKAVRTLDMMLELKRGIEALLDDNAGNWYYSLQYIVTLWMTKVHDNSGISCWVDGKNGKQEDCRLASNPDQEPQLFTSWLAIRKWIRTREPRDSRADIFLLPIICIIESYLTVIVLEFGIRAWDQLLYSWILDFDCFQGVFCFISKLLSVLIIFTEKKKVVV